MPLPNNAKTVFTVVNMLTGPVYSGPNEEIVGTRCWPYTNATNSEGRPYFRVNGKNVLAYRLVYELMIGPPGKKMVRHKCDNPICCNPKHLTLGTNTENMADMKERERHGMPHHVVRAMRKLAAGGMSHQEIADLYGKGRSTVTEAINGDTYGHVGDDE